MANLLDSTAQVLVNPVNTEGVMGKGLALEFKKLYPSMFLLYRSACHRGHIRLGQVWAYDDPGGKTILNFPTKVHWRNPSRLIGAVQEAHMDVFWALTGFGLMLALIIAAANGNWPFK